jgi:6-pyruvoyltetrahydropterin/6-carboxytetrahydropterin synthase
MKIQTEVRLSSAHQLPNYPGKCHNLHGHDFRVIIIIEGEQGEYDFILDFVKIKEVMSKYDHAYLNDFIENPTAENLAYKFANEIKELGWEEDINKGNRFSSVTVRVFESEVAFAEITI